MRRHGVRVGARDGSTGGRRRRPGAASGALCCVLAVGLVGGPRVGRAQAPVETSGRSLYEQGRFAEAARAFEAEQTLKGLYNAGMARHNAEHHALAVDRWTRYAAEAPAAEQPGVAAWIDKARAKLAPVRLAADAAPVARRLTLEREGRSEDAWTITWPPGQGVITVELDAGEWTASLGGGSSPTVRTTVTVRTDAPTVASLVRPPSAAPVQLRLGPTRALRRGVTLTWSGGAAAPVEETTRVEDVRRDMLPGTWSVRARARGFLAQERPFTVAEGPTEVRVTLERDPLDRARVGVASGLGATAGALIVTGAVLAPLGRKGFEGATGCWEDADATCEPLADATMQATLGAGLLGAGLGAVIPAVTTGRGAGRRALGIEAGIGAALLAAGGAGYIADQTTLDHRRTARDLELGQIAGGVMGAGAGMLIGALVGVIVERRTGRRRPASDAGGTSHGAKDR